MINCAYVTFRDVGLKGLGGKSRELCKQIINCGLSDYVMVDTCNRVELYSTEDVGVFGFKWLKGVDAVRHLFQVACGLDSMVLGENEILAQLKNAHMKAVSGGHCGESLSRLFENAVRLGSRVRAKTKISMGKTSIASLAVDHVFGREKIQVNEVLIIGSGAMGSKLACALKNKGVKQIFLANRRRERAKKLADTVGGVVVDFHEIRRYLCNASVVFTATSAPHAIIRPEMITEGGKILFVDLGIPYDVSEDVERLDDVAVIRLDYLRGIARENWRNKKSEISKAEVMIDERIKKLEFENPF